MGKNIFNSVLLPKISSNSFDLSHDVKFSFSMGRLVPTMAIDTLPGDKFSFSSENMLRFMPLVTPVMHKVDVNSYNFFVPTRTLWPEWEDWVTRKSDVEAPYLSLNEIAVGSLMDYLGYPTGDFTGVPGGNIKVSAIPLAAYLKTYNEYFRDENLQDEYPWELVPGENVVNLIGVLDWNLNPPPRAAWKPDYFNKALPFAQQGDSVMLPLTTTQEVDVELNLTGQPGLMRTTAGALSANGDIVQSAGPSPLTSSVHVDGNPAVYDPNGSLSVDVQANATDINTLRWALRMQEWLERNIRGGARYVEQLLSHFGVRSSDARLQRPEFIGMTSQNMVISEVLSTAQTDPAADGAPIGQMAGHGISLGGGNRMSTYCEEHGYLLSMIVVRPKTAYQQGCHKSLQRFSAFDYGWPTFAHLGEREVKQVEIYAETTVPDKSFGYVPQYAEYKFMNSRVAGEFKTTLSDWHLGIIFDSDPELNEEFIQCNPRTNIFAVTDPNEDHIVAHVFHNIYVRRKLPKFGIPQI